MAPSIFAVATSKNHHQKNRHLRKIVGIGSVVLVSFVGLSNLNPTAAAAPTETVYVKPEAALTKSDLSESQIAQLERYLADIYTSLEAMTDDSTGLPADNISGDLSASGTSSYTSPTNIGGYLWSTVIARDAGILTHQEASSRLNQTINTVAGLQRHAASGMFYNWYDPQTSQRVEIWPDDGNTVQQFLSSVDNGWLAAGLLIAAQADASVKTAAMEIYDSMHFGAYFNPEAANGLGLIRGGFWDQDQPAGSVPGDYLNTGTEVYYTGHHYDTTVSETRIALYIGIAKGEIPATAYYGTYRTFPSNCDWSWQEQRPSGVTRTYNGIEVYEGVYHYGGMNIVPGWGGSMFEALMPNMLVPEEKWGANSWGVNHPLFVKAQIEHGLVEANYGYWGFSPSSNPFGGYKEYGVDQLGLNSDGYLSDGVTSYDGGFFGCTEATNANPEYGDGVVTPHASFLGLSYDAIAVLDNATKMETELNAYGPGGFYDAIAVKSGTVANRYLSLDQSMIVAAIGNFLYADALRTYFVTPDLEASLRPVMEVEVFSASASTVIPALTSHLNEVVVEDSTITLAGTGEPGAQLKVASSAKRSSGPLCETNVNATGQWECAITLAEGTNTLSLATINDAGVSSETISYVITRAGADATPSPSSASPDNTTSKSTASSVLETPANASSGSNTRLAKTGASVLGWLLAMAFVGTTGIVLVRKQRNHGQ